MSEYKDTINLPATDFPMKANLSEREPVLLKKWNEMNLYAEISKARKGHKKFILHDGPPYANGKIHLGHVVNKVLKDIIVKSRLMSGYNAPYVPGWDCHGLPIEHIVEKKKGKAGEKISHKDFRDACRSYALEQMQQQREDFKRLGILGDWNNPYLTMDPTYEANIMRSFGKIVERGHLVQGRKPVHWCVDCASALAEAEVEYKDKASPAIYVRFHVLDEASLLERLHHSPNLAASHTIGEVRLSVPIWTTTPWTLPANQAVALNPTLEYVVVQCEQAGHKELFLVAEALLKDAMGHFGIENYRVIAYGPGAELEGLRLQHPFYDREVPIVMGDHVTVDTGTGAVHTAPGHGPDDYNVCRKYNIEILNPVNSKGVFTEDTQFFAGLHIFKANDAIIELLKSKGNLIHHESLTHSYPHCWRHKTPLLFRATPQWFISMDKENLRRDALNAIFKVRWIPETGEGRLSSMLENRPDWCISRQRSWGVPMPLFVHKETEELHPNTLSLIDTVAKLVEKEGVEAWFDLDAEMILGEDAENYRKNTDILDVWFDSGVSHQCVLKQRPELHYPADVYLEGTDQHRGWFHSSLLTAIAMGQKAPFKTVLTHGFTVDANGHKMSKSLGNTIEPEQVMKTLGADILRLWIVSTDYSNEMTVSDEVFKRNADTYRRLRNTARYLLANLSDFDPEQHTVPAEAMLELDRWAVNQARLLQNEIIEAYNNFQFHDIYQKTHNFCSIEMGSFYLDIIKDRQYTMQKDSLARRSAQTAMLMILEGLVRWLAPILSFTAEEIWQHMPGKREQSVFLAEWFKDFLEPVVKDGFDAVFWQQVMEVRDAVNKALEQQRATGKIGAPLEAEIILYCSKDLEQALLQLKDELRFVLITSGATVQPLSHAPDTALETGLAGLKLIINVVDYPKCVRCWHRRADIGSHKEHPELCGRCVENVAGAGEERQFA